MSTYATVAAGKLRAFVERIERIEADIKDLNGDKSEVYKELRGEGFDVKAVRQCVAARKLDSDELQERNAVFDLYWEALTGASRVHVHEDEEFDPETGEFTSQSRPVNPAQEPTDYAAQLGDESAAIVPYREPSVEVVRDDGAMHEVGCGEGSQPHLPSDRAENKPGATAVIAGAPNSPSARSSSRADPCSTRRDFYFNSVVPYEGDECLIWPFATSSDGYAKCRFIPGGKEEYVSRVLCEEANGPPPTKSHQAAHSCGNGRSGCVAKRHLAWKTRVENEADKVVHGTSTRGENGSNAKLTRDDVWQIMSLRGSMSQREIANRFDVSKSLINQIHSGKSWSWLTSEAA